MASYLIHVSACSLDLTAQLSLRHQVLPGPTNKTGSVVSSCTAQCKEHFITKNAFDHLQSALTLTNATFPSFTKA